MDTYIKTRSLSPFNINDKSPHGLCFATEKLTFRLKYLQL